ncbi:hypothetical protein [Rhodovulum steppense]|uniref:Uncharacterized protein n=1 Tax=Rhodovulum steppense TaxID=540251 RepID=A0A4R1Z322_9RHOB|nr:hypothetical protein [Rhodovulum steppense]TCM88028.1 hypothetical protein EV216_10138 [Rhodovulum steppense]
MRGRGSQVSPCAALLAAALVGSPAVAQSYEEAVRANLALVLEICIQGSDALEWAAAFQTAGFIPSQRVHPEYGPVPIFLAPADTVVTEIHDERFGSGSCIAQTRHMGLNEAIPFVGAFVTQRYAGPGGFERDTHNPDNPCAGYLMPFSEHSAMWLSFDSADQPGACVEDGTARMTVSGPT